jgi:signal transduction histidine kinase
MSPTETLRERVLVAWVLLGAGMVAALLLCWALAVGLAGWVLRPVHALDEATQAVATGRLTARVPQTIGPPELRRLGGAFNDMAESVEALLAQQRTFVADASHQLRNPLSALLLRLDSVALAEPDLDVRLEPVRAEGRRLTEVLDELLQLARTEHATTVAVPVPLGPLVLDRDEAWQVVARRKGVLLDVHVHGDPVALAEATALSGAVDALLDNAIKFSPEGGAVALHAERTGEGVAGDGVVIRVRNRDDMLEETDVQRFGDRFWRAAGHQNVPGSGLGLAIVRVLADRWGGALEASRPGPGQLEVRLCLPAADRPGRARLGQPAVSR